MILVAFMLIHGITWIGGVPDTRSIRNPFRSVPPVGDVVYERNHRGQGRYDRADRLNPIRYLHVPPFFVYLYSSTATIIINSDTPQGTPAPGRNPHQYPPPTGRGEGTTCDTADAHGATARNSSPAGNATAKPTGRPTNASEEQQHNADTTPATGPYAPPGRASSNQDTQRTVQDAANP